MRVGGTRTWCNLNSVVRIKKFREEALHLDHRVLLPLRLFFVLVSVLVMVSRFRVLVHFARVTSLALILSVTGCMMSSITI